MKHVNFGKGEQVSLFTSLAIEIASRCNRHCYFCPNGYFDRVDEDMDVALVEKVLDELAALKYRGRIEWYIYNEPTRCKNLAAYIRLARRLLPGCCQMINTNGDFFKNQSDILRLFSLGLNQMQINVYSASDAHPDPKQFQKGVEEARRREQKFVGWLDELGIPQNLSLYQHIGSSKHAAKVVAKYGIRPTVRNEDIEGPNQFSNRSGLIPSFREGLREPLNKMCVRPFRFLNINFNGDGLLCCNDYYGKRTFGNIKTHTLVEIWNHPVLNEYRLKLKNKNRNAFLCDVCDFQGGFYPHMTDTLTSGSKAVDADILERYILSDSNPSLSIKKQGKELFPIINQPKRFV